MKAERRTSLPWAAAAWVVGATLWFFTRDLAGAGSRAGVAGALLLVPEQLWEANPDVPAGWGGVLHGWRWAAWGTAALTWAVGWSWGEVLLVWVGVGKLTWCERRACAAGLGMAALSVTVLGLSLAGLGMFLLGFVLSAFGVLHHLIQGRATCWRRELLGPFRATFGSADERGAASVPDAPSVRDASPATWERRLAPALAAAPFLGLMLLGSTVPTTEFDAREYHLQGPKEWFLAGRVEPLRHNVYTRMPAGTEMLTLLCMHLCDDWRVGALAGQATLAGFVPLAALAAGCVARRLFGRGAGWFAAAAFLTSPWAVRLAIHPYAEGALCAYGTLALLAVTIAVRRRRLRSARPALLAGLLAGAAFACKYPALLLIAAPAGLVVALASPVRRWKKLAAFACGFAVFAGPWLLKNAVETGNPVFPLLWGVFGGTGWDAATNARWVAAHAPPDWAPARWPHWFGQPVGLDTFHTPLVIGFAPLAGFVSPRRAGRLAAALGGLVLVWYLATHRIDRFWVPLLPAACALAGAGLRWATSREEPAVRTTAWAAAAGGVLFNLALCVGGLAGPVPFAADPEAASEWVERTNAPLISALNERFGPGEPVVLIGEAQAFGAEFTPIYATVWNPPPLADPDKPPPLGVAAVAVNWTEIARYRSSYGFDPRVTPGFLDARVRRGELLPPEPVTVDGRVVGELYAVP